MDKLSLGVRRAGKEEKGEQALLTMKVIVEVTA